MSLTNEERDSLSIKFCEMEEMVAPFLPFLDIYPYLCHQN